MSRAPRPPVPIARRANPSRRSPSSSRLPGASLFTVGALISALVVGCGSLIGLDGYKKSDRPSGSGGGGGEGGEPNSDRCLRDAACNDDNPCTTDTCDRGSCVHTTVTAAAECSGGVCNGIVGAEACVRCVDDQPGDGRDSGCTLRAPQCRTSGTPTCVGCQEHEDCDDGNDCTLDACKGDRTCEYTPLATGAKCDGGVCNGEAGAEACVSCADTAEGLDTDLGCSTDRPLCSDGLCRRCLDTGESGRVDLGCDNTTPACDETLDSCVACVRNEDCPRDEHDCTEEVCDDGTCRHVPNDELCDSDNACPSSCDAETGCIQFTALELLADPSFEQDAHWTANEVNQDDPDKTYIWVPLDRLVVLSPTARTGDRVARLTSRADQGAALFQSVRLPGNTRALVASGFYRSSSNGSFSPTDYFDGVFWHGEVDGTFHNYFVTTGASPSPLVLPVEAADWTEFTSIITDLSAFPRIADPEYNLLGHTNSDATVVQYEIDDVSLKACF